MLHRCQVVVFSVNKPSKSNLVEVQDGQISGQEAALSHVCVGFDYAWRNIGLCALLSHVVEIFFDIETCSKGKEAAHPLRYSLPGSRTPDHP